MIGYLYQHRAWDISMIRLADADPTEMRSRYINLMKSGANKGGVPQSIPIQAPANLLCTHCQTKQASVFCTCFDTTTLLCTQDISQHFEQYSSAIAHPILPISAMKDFSSISDPSYYDGFHQRSAAFSQGKKALRANLEQMDKCCQDTEIAIDELITSLTKFKDEIINQVKGFKRKLEADIAKAEEEVQTTLSQKSPALTTQLAKALRDFKAGGLKLFTYQVNSRALEQMLPQTVNCKLSEPNIQMRDSDFDQGPYSGEEEEPLEVPQRVCRNCQQAAGVLVCFECGISTCYQCMPCGNCGSQSLRLESN